MITTETEQVVLAAAASRAPAITAPAPSLPPDIDQAQRFLKALDKEAEKHYFQTFGDAKKGRSLISLRFASLDDAKANLTRLNDSGAGIFVTINRTDGHGRKIENIDKIRAIYLDFDDAETAFEKVESLSQKLQPSMVIESSLGKFHVYFLVTDMTTANGTQWLAHLIGLTGADPNCKDISRVLRLPGFYHRKHEPFMTRIVSIANDGTPMPYTVAELEQAFGAAPAEIQKPDKPKISTGPRAPFDSAPGSTIKKGGRNSMLTSLAGTMRYRGMSEAAILAALVAENVSRCDLPLDDAEVKAIAASIAGYPPSNEGDSTTGETPEQVIARLAVLGPIAYDQHRIAEAKNLGIRQSTLDKRVNSARSETGRKVPAPFPEVQAWPDPVDGADLLNEIVATIRQQIICEPETATAAALWVAMTYLVDQFDIAPLAVITAPEPRCGKSGFRRLLGTMVYQPMSVENMSSAVLFRAFDMWCPTLLIDEYDTFIQNDEAMRGIINAGHERGGQVWRCVGDDHTPTAFNVYGPKLLSGIGKLPATIIDRSILLVLRRKLTTETVKRQRDVAKSYFESIQQKLMRFAADQAATVGAARPAIPIELNDRQQDNWEPLFQIAETVGGNWPALAKQAALKLSCSKDDVQSRGVELLGDIKEVLGWSTVPPATISTAELIKELCSDPEMPWATYYRGNAISPRQLAKLLKAFGIESGSVRCGASTSKGYKVADFKDALERYL